MSPNSTLTTPLSPVRGVAHNEVITSDHLQFRDSSSKLCTFQMDPLCVPLLSSRTPTGCALPAIPPLFPTPFGPFSSLTLTTLLKLGIKLGELNIYLFSTDQYTHYFHKVSIFGKRSTPRLSSPLLSSTALFVRVLLLLPLSVKPRL